MPSQSNYEVDRKVAAKSEQKRRGKDHLKKKLKKPKLQKYSNEKEDPHLLKSNPYRKKRKALPSRLYNAR